MVLFEKPYLTILYDQEINCIQQNWKGFANSSDFRDGILKSVHFFKQKKADKILSNTKEFSVAKKADTDWIAKDIMPILVANGMKKMAFIVPSSVFAQVSVDNFKEEADNFVAIRYFDDLQKAKSWMSGVQAHV